MKDWIADLAGVAELSETLGVSRQAVSNWNAGRSRDGFPAPLTRLRSGPIWSRHAVLAWWDHQNVNAS